MKSFLASFGRALLTLVVVLVAILAGWELWSYYMLEPWTRDGRVRADVVRVAADVSGLISDVFVHDNERASSYSALISGPSNMRSIRPKPMWRASRRPSIKPNAILCGARA